jgi:hypothetical protein
MGSPFDRSRSTEGVETHVELGFAGKLSREGIARNQKWHKMMLQSCYDTKKEEPQGLSLVG